MPTITSTKQAKLTEKERLDKDKTLLSRLIQERTKDVEPEWDFAINYVVPQLGKWGDKIWEDKRVDTTATESVELAGDSMFGNLISRHADWTAYKAAADELNKDPDFVEYLKQRKEALYSELERSNFYDVMPGFIKIGISIETASIFVGEDIEEQQCFLKVLHPWGVYVTQDITGKTNRRIRKFQLTPDQADERFDKNKFSTVLKKAVKDNTRTKYWFVEIIEKRKHRDESKIDAINMPIASRYYEVGGEDHYLEEGGYPSWPLMVWRFETLGNSPYGYGPTRVLKKKILRANNVDATILRANHKAVDAPIQAPAGLRGKVNTNPGDTTWLENMNEHIVDGPRQGKLAAGDKELDRVQQSIKDGYKVSYFMLLFDNEDKDRTAYEVHEVKSEKATVTGSTIGKFVSEALELILSRIDQIGIDSGRIPEVPEEFIDKYGGAEIKFEFLGPLAQLQKQQVNINGIMQSLEASRGVLEIDADARLHINTGEVLRKIWTTYDAADSLNKQEDVDEMLQQRAAAMKQQKQVEQLEQVSKAIPGLGKQVEPGSVLAGQQEGSGG